MRSFWRGIARICIGVAAAFGLATGPARVAAATYYVDFASGSDRASGLSPKQAWKRAPGDSRAGEIPRLTRLMPGDTLLFRANVRYRGTIVVRHAGTADSPIRYLGEGWGEGRAAIDGSEPVAEPRPCRSAADCGGEAGWRLLLRARLPEGAHAVDGLFQDDWPLPLAGPGAGLLPGAVRQLPRSGGRDLVLHPYPDVPADFSRGSARVGFLLLAGGHVEIRGFELARFAAAP
ncbi:MAG: hypothetical protein ACRC1J_01200, partial [Sandaracinobacteroides sp.]